MRTASKPAEMSWAWAICLERRVTGQREQAGAQPLLPQLHPLTPILQGKLRPRSPQQLLWKLYMMPQMETQQCLSQRLPQASA